MTPEERHLRMIRFESKTGHTDYPRARDPILDENYTPAELNNGYVLYENIPILGIVVTFVEPQPE